MLIDAYRRRRLSDHRDKLSRHFDTGEMIVMSNAALADAQLAQERLGMFDHPKLAGRDLFTVRHTARKAGARRLVESGKL